MGNKRSDAIHPSIQLVISKKPDASVQPNTAPLRAARSETEQ